MYFVVIILCILPLIKRSRYALDRMRNSLWFLAGEIISEKSRSGQLPDTWKWLWFISHTSAFMLIISLPYHLNFHPRMWPPIWPMIPLSYLRMPLASSLEACVPPKRIFARILVFSHFCFLFLWFWLVPVPSTTKDLWPYINSSSFVHRSITILCS